MKVLKLTSIALLFCFYANAQPDSTLLFESSKGYWSFPVSNYSTLEKFGRNEINDRVYYSLCTSFVNDSALMVSAVYDGKVELVAKIEDFYVIIVKYGDYFVTYSGLNKPIVKSKDNILKGQNLALTERAFDGKYRLDVFLSKGNDNLDAFEWFAPAGLLAMENH